MKNLKSIMLLALVLIVAVFCFASCANENTPEQSSGPESEHQHVFGDDEGNTILIRLPKNADGKAYSTWTEGKVVVGDTIRVYGKPTKNTGSPATQKAKVEG